MNLLETYRDPKDGAISVRAKSFTVTVTEDAVNIVIDGVIVHQWRRIQQHSDEAPPRRSVGTNRRRGSR